MQLVRTDVHNEAMSGAAHAGGESIVSGKDNLKQESQFLAHESMNDLVLENRRFRVIDPGPSLSASELTAFEANLGVGLPAQLHDFYLRWNGGLPYPTDVSDDKSVWVRLRWRDGAEAARVGPATSFGPLFRVNAAPEIDFLRAWTDFRDRIPGDLLCFAQDPGGSLFLMGVRAHNLGKIYFWERSFEADIEAGEEPDYRNVADVADSFAELLLALREEPHRREPLDAWVRRMYPERH